MEGGGGVKTCQRRVYRPGFSGGRRGGRGGGGGLEEPVKILGVEGGGLEEPVKILGVGGGGLEEPVKNTKISIMIYGLTKSVGKKHKRRKSNIQAVLKPHLNTNCR